MIVPRYWAEGRVQQRRDGRQITVRRFGWSNSSQTEAQQLADSRTREALDRISAGEKLPKTEPKLAYNGAQGVPIREEIISEHGSTVVTRNLYGALCLNTPGVLFADIDFTPPHSTVSCSVIAGSALLAVATGFALHSALIGAMTFIVALLLGSTVPKLLNRARNEPGKLRARALGRLQAFLNAHPEWRIAIYDTPAGLRLLALQRPFKPDEPQTLTFFKEVGADSVYVRMCKNQQCFRARLTPKPWRIGISEHLRPRPGVWPIRPERMAERQSWVRSYDQAALGFAACRYVETLGTGVPDNHASAVQRLHDDLSRAKSGLPIA